MKRLRIRNGADRSLGTGSLKPDTEEMMAKHDISFRTAGLRHLGQDNRGSTAKTGQVVQDILDRTAGTGQSVQVFLFRIKRTDWPEHDSKDITGTGHP
jgi:hypothetical protein